MRQCAARCLCPTHGAAIRTRVATAFRDGPYVDSIGMPLGRSRDLSTAPASRASFAPFPPSDDRLSGTLGRGDIGCCARPPEVVHTSTAKVVLATPTDVDLVLHVLAWMRQFPIRRPPQGPQGKSLSVGAGNWLTVDEPGAQVAAMQQSRKLALSTIRRDI